MQAFNWEIETNPILKAKKKAVSTNFNICTVKSLEKLKSLSNFLLLHERYEELNEIGDLFDGFIEDDLRRMHFCVFIRTINIYSLYKSHKKQNIIDFKLENLKKEEKGNFNLGAFGIGQNFKSRTNMLDIYYAQFSFNDKVQLLIERAIGALNLMYLGTQDVIDEYRYCPEGDIKDISVLQGIADKEMMKAKELWKSKYINHDNKKKSQKFLKEINQSFANLPALNWELEPNTLLQTKKKLLFRKFSISYYSTSSDLASLTAHLYLAKKWQDIISIGKILEAYENENTTNGLEYAQIIAYYIQCLKLSDEKNDVLILQETQKMKNYKGVNALNSQGLKSAFSNLTLFHEEKNDKLQIHLFTTVIYECLFLLHLDIPKECKYTKEEVESYLQEYTQKARELFQKL